MRPPAAASARKVRLFVTCIVDALYPEVGRATVELLERLGWEITFPEEQTCCGLPLYNSGHLEEARKVAARNLEAVGIGDPLVVPSGSCAWMLRKVYPELSSDPRMKLFSASVTDLTEFLVAHGAPSLEASQPMRVAYHPSCHALRGLGISAQPGILLKNVQGVEVAPLEKVDECCGFGGSFAVRHGQLSESMMNSKLDAVTNAGVMTLLVPDPGCLMHLECGARRRGCGFKVRHLAEVLAEAKLADVDA
jgi:L-lactate dehydrogenase complex protein LldE